MNFWILNAHVQFSVCPSCLCVQWTEADHTRVWVKQKVKCSCKNTIHSYLWMFGFERKHILINYNNSNYLLKPPALFLSVDVFACVKYTQRGISWVVLSTARCSTCYKKVPHCSNTNNNVKPTHPESYKDSKRKQEDAQTPPVVRPKTFRVFSEAKHIQVQEALLLVITSAREVAMVMFLQSDKTSFNNFDDDMMCN